jgi:antitoxin (DNA-binding transcriptional repressor) of toxin-antitoxin stability system
VVVADRGTPIATVVPYEGTPTPKVQVRKARKDPKKLARLRYPPLPGKKADSLELLLEERGERR